MNNIYFLIYYNSLKSHFLLALNSENAWFAALQFGGYNMALATFFALIGSTLGMCINYGMGYYISRWREDAPVYNEAVYNRISAYFSNKLFLLMAVPPVLSLLEMMPGLSLFVMINGIFRVPPGRAIAAIACSRILYYSYYLLQ